MFVWNWPWWTLEFCDLHSMRSLETSPRDGFVYVSWLFWVEGFGCFGTILGILLLVVQKSGEKTTWDVQNLVNNGITNQPQLIQDFFHQKYWTGKYEQNSGHISCAMERYTTTIQYISGNKQMIGVVSCWRFSRQTISVQGWPSHRETLTLPWWKEGWDPQGQNGMNHIQDIHIYWHILTYHHSHVHPRCEIKTESLKGSVQGPTDPKLTNRYAAGCGNWRVLYPYGYLQDQETWTPDFSCEPSKLCAKNIKSPKKNPPSMPALKPFFSAKNRIKDIFSWGVRSSL